MHIIVLLRDVLGARSPRRPYYGKNIEYGCIVLLASAHTVVVAGGGRRPALLFFLWFSLFSLARCVACGGVPVVLTCWRPKKSKKIPGRELWRWIKYPDFIYLLFIWLDVYMINGWGLTRVRQQHRAQTLLGAASQRGWKPFKKF